MDENEARAALSEVNRRRGHATWLALWAGTPRWSVLAAVAILLAHTLTSDLRALDPAPDGWFLRWGTWLLTLALLTAVGWVAHRRSPVTAHRSTFGERMAVCAVLLVVLYVLLMVIGVPMRYAGIPFDQTVSVAGALVLLFLGVRLWSRRLGHRA